MNSDFRENYKYWVENDDIYIPRINNDNENYFKDLFSKFANFGTSGIRAKMDIGFNRLNIHTVSHITKCIAKKSVGKTVVIGYDARNNSKEFAQTVAIVMNDYGVKTYLFDHIVSTPILSFATKKLKCAFGIMITASHNPPEYNGYKVYNAYGSQISPSVACEIMQDINTNPFEFFDKSRKFDCTKHEIISDNLGYENEVFENLINKKLLKTDDYKVCYSALCGVGDKIAHDVSSVCGFNGLISVKSQSKPDGDFKSCRNPNPEYLPSFDEGIKILCEKKAQLLIATDPDADRVGCVSFDNKGDIYYFSGNQIAILLSNYILENRENRPDDFIISTIVSSKMINEITGKYNIKSKRVLPGFKYIGDVLTEMEINKKSENYVFSFEESLGYHKGFYTFDKDGILSMFLIIEMAIFYKNQGISLYEKMQMLYKELGDFKEKVVTICCDNNEKSSNDFMTNLREKKELLIDGYDLLSVKDYLPFENILEYDFSNKMSIIIRPSGTEPKLKIYISALSDKEIQSIEEQLKI